MTVGLVLAAVAFWLVHVSERRQARETALPEATPGPAVPRGVQDVLAVLRSAGIEPEPEPEPEPGHGFNFGSGGGNGGKGGSAYGGDGGFAIGGSLLRCCLGQC